MIKEKKSLKGKLPSRRKFFKAAAATGPGVTLAADAATVGPYLMIPLPIAGAALTSAFLAALPIGAVSLPPLKKSAIPKAIARRSKSFLDIVTILDGLCS